jgi:predicted permease
MAVYTILQQVSILAILSLVGVAGVKAGIFSENAKSTLEKLVFYVTLPLLIITKLSMLELTPVILKNGLWVIVGTYLILFIQIVIGRLSARLFKMEKAQSTIHSLHTFLGNIVFLGFPLLDALFPGGEAILYAALYQLAMNTVFWTYGIMQLAPGARGQGMKNTRKMLNPNTIALLVAGIMLSFNLHLPAVLQSALGGLGGTTLYLAMLYIGILLSGTKIWPMVRKPDVLFLSLNKLILMPVLFIALFWLLFSFTPFRINEIAISVLVLEAAMPCMTILVLLAKHYGADDQKAMENFVVTTVFSVLSLPLVLFLLNVLLNSMQTGLIQ